MAPLTNPTDRLKDSEVKREEGQIEKPARFSPNAVSLTIKRAEPDAGEDIEHQCELGWAENHFEILSASRAISLKAR